MAEATKTTRTVTQDVYTLTMSPAEYDYLKTLIGDQHANDGDGASGRIWKALKAPAEAAASTYTVDGTAYDLSAEYRDAADDVWYFTGERNEDGVPLMTCRLSDRDGINPANFQDWPLTRVLAEFTLNRL
ncbi:phiSA1p31-related protein [Streptomyces koyangensis]